jgi:hypothetical protein
MSSPNETVFAMMQRRLLQQQQKEAAEKAWADKLSKNYERNKGYAKEDNYATLLNPETEAKFRQWLAANKIPFNPDAKVADYDMRGFWKALQLGDSRAISAIDPNDNKLHYPDYWKTPYHETFSAESQWAAPGAPTWNAKDQLVTPDGKVLFDDKAKKQP